MNFLYKWWFTKFLMPIRLHFLFEAAAPIIEDAVAPEIATSVGVGDVFGGNQLLNAGAGLGDIGSDLTAETLANGLPNLSTSGPMAQEIATGGIGAGQGVNAAAVQNAATQIPNSGIQALAQNQVSALAPATDTATNLGYNTIAQNPLDAASVNSPQEAFRLSEIAAQNAGQGASSVFDNLSNNPLIQGAKSAYSMISNFAKENPISTGVGAYMLANKLGANKVNGTGIAPQGPGILGDYQLNPNTFSGFHPNPQNYTAQQTMFSNMPVMHAAIGGIMQAAPNYPMAHNMNAQYTNPNPQMPIPSDVTGMSGIQSYDKGGKLSTADEISLLNSYQNMWSPQSTSSGVANFKDPSLSFTDSATVGMSPLEAAMYRQKQINSRALMQGPQLNLPQSGIGQVNLTPLMAAKQKAADQQAIQAASGGEDNNVNGSAHGGIMQAHGHLGNYAHGGNPRLLKGPGDGMSDNIPATIDGKQPARLATGEFVVPADVVSHMGNGDTDAGAKKLHDWMATVRKARTGNSKQGKEINADKYLPK